MALSRYANIALDAYTLEELRREYYSLGPKGRVRLLQRLSRKSTLHEEMRKLAVEDRNALVRQWIARQVEELYDHEDQIERLKHDPDQFVRACLFEGPAIKINSVLGTETDWLARFKEANHIQRLAMMRNPEIHDKFVEMVFDPEDTKLDIDLKVRAQLVFAILSNKWAVEAHGWVPIGDDSYGADRGNREDKEHFGTLWALAAKWPTDSGVPYLVYQHVSIDSETKLRVYRQCDEEPHLRIAILENDLPELDERGQRARGPSKVLKVGKKDKDQICREVAYSKASRGGGTTTVMGYPLSLVAAGIGFIGGAAAVYLVIALVKSL